MMHTCLTGILLVLRMGCNTEIIVQLVKASTLCESVCMGSLMKQSCVPPLHSPCSRLQFFRQDLSQTESKGSATSRHPPLQDVELRWPFL